MAPKTTRRNDLLRSHPLRVALVVLAALATMAGVLTPTATSAAPTEAPVITPFNPPLGGFRSNPQISWSRLSGVSKYKLQVSTSQGFVPTVVNQDTYNTTYSPPTDLAPGTYYVRVQGNEGGAGPWSSVVSFEKTITSAPELYGPADGATFEFPKQSPIFTWEAIDGAAKYTLEVDDAPDFVGAYSQDFGGPAATQIGTLIPGQTYYWRVRATVAGNTVTAWSQIRSYTVEWAVDGQISPVPTSPAYVDGQAPLTRVRDVTLQWTSMMGTKSYQLQINRNEDFSGVDVVNTTVFSTSYTPPTNYAMGAYWWRIRARDANNNLGPWSPKAGFERFWGDSPLLTTPTNWSPSNNVKMADPPYFAWTPVPLAARYEVQWSTEENFSQPGLIDSCQTVHTDLSWLSVNQGSGTSCVPGKNDDYDTRVFWRVRGLDQTSNVIGPWSPTWSFICTTSAPVTLLSPSSGSNQSAPVLTWKPVDGAPTYVVTVLRNNSSQQSKVETTATTYVPTENFNVVDSPFTWFVQAKDRSGNLSVPSASRTFAYVAPASTGTVPTISAPANNAQSNRLPAMTWQPVTGASSYRVYYRTFGTSGWSVLVDSIANSGYTHSNPLPKGVYEWYPAANLGNNVFVPTTPRVFEVTAPDDINYTTISPVKCEGTGGCQASTSVPKLKWDPVPGACFRVWVAFDPQFTNVFKRYDIAFSEMQISDEFPDNDVGQAYYWHVQTYAGKCGESPGSLDPQGRPGGVVAPSGAFQKRSAPVDLVSPVAGDVVDQPTFNWNDYVETNGKVGTRGYRFQVSTVANFQSTIDNRVLDQTTYTPYDVTYPEGPIYWRVRAIDGSNNELTWSVMPPLNKTAPSLLDLEVAGAVGNKVKGLPILSWAPQAFAKSYKVEIYKNGDANFSPANRILTFDTNFSSVMPYSMLPLGDYTWRVQRQDAQDRPGPWLVWAGNNVQNSKDKSPALLSIIADAPTPVAPTNGATINTDDIVLSWTAPQVVQTTKYKVEVNTSAAFDGTKVEEQTTVMKSWAPTKKYDDGTYYWRVNALDSSGTVIGTSATRSFVKVSYDLPTAPLSVVVASTPGTINISWNPPSGAGDPVFTQYRVKVTQGDGPGQVVIADKLISKSLRSARFNGLMNGKSYDVVVSAVSVKGETSAAKKSGEPKGCSNTPFSDVSSNHPFCEQIRWMYTQGITTGTVINDNTPAKGTVLYQPADPVSRQAMAAFLYRYAGEPTVIPQAPRFADVGSTAPFFDEIQWMAQSGLSLGYPNPGGGLPLYKPNAAVTRQAMAAMLVRYDDGTHTYPPDSQQFRDVPPSQTFYSAIQWMALSGLSLGYPVPGGGLPQYRPVENVSRQAMAAFLFRFKVLPAAMVSSGADETAPPATPLEVVPPQEMTTTTVAPEPSTTTTTVESTPTTTSSPLKTAA